MHISGDVSNDKTFEFSNGTKKSSLHQSLVCKYTVTATKILKVKTFLRKIVVFVYSC